VCYWRLATAVCLNVRRNRPSRDEAALVGGLLHFDSPALCINRQFSESYNQDISKSVLSKLFEPVGTFTYKSLSVQVRIDFLAMLSFVPIVNSNHSVFQ
jgi:hypothetical protein